MYYQGYGVKKNLAKAAALFTQSANQNYAPSLSNLAVMYSKGEVLKRIWINLGNIRLKLLKQVMRSHNLI
ncbi:MAG: hypothetical protein WB445_13240 [Acinetobacter sp.]